MSLPSLLEVIQESFEDVALDSAPLRARSVRSAPRQKLLPNCTLSAQDTNSQVNLLITPSQRLRLNQKKRTRTAEMLHGSDMVDAVDFLSDDELPDDLIVYNVPYSRPLKSLAQRDQAYRPSRMRPLRISRSASSVSSFGSPQTRASSIFSISSDCSELSLLEDEAKFSDEARLLGLNEDPQINESLQRISMLNSYKHVSAPNVSKEKLGYLTVTRQTNLPPKDPREASKHTRDYEQLLQSQMDKEQKKLEERKKQLAALAKQTDIDRKTWRTVLRDYDALVCSAETRELWWRGVPKDLRPRVWIRQMGRSSLSTEQTQQYLSEADEIIDKACDLKVAKLDTAQFARDNSKNYTLIESVEEYSALIQQAFPNLLVFQYGQAFDSILRTILAFRLCQRESTDPLFREIKVSHLVNLICVLYYNLRDETLTLRMFTSLMSKKMMYHLQTDTNLEYLQDIVAQFDKFLAKTSPNIHQHFEHIGLQPQLILAPTVSNIFSKMLNMDICSRLVDIYIFEGDTFLLRVLLALIRKVQYKLLGTKEEVCTILGDDCLSLLNRSKVSGYRYLDVGDATEFICDVRTILRRQGSSYFTTAKSPLTSSFCSTSSSGLSVSAGLDSSVLGAEKLKLNVEVAGAAAAAAGVDPKLNGLAASAGLGALAPKLNPLDGAENENTGLAGCDSSLASGLVSDGLENENADDEPNENAGVGADAVSELGSGSEAFGSSLAGALNENAGLANADSAGLPNEKAGTAASAGLDWPKVNAGFSAGCSAGCSVGFAAGSSFFGNLNTSSFI